MFTSKDARPEISFNNDELDQVVSIFKALSDHSRIQVLSALTSRKSLCVSDIAGHLNMPISRVSHHLSILKMLGFVKSRQEGKQVFYSIEDECVTDIMKRARDHVAGD